MTFLLIFIIFLFLAGFLMPRLLPLLVRLWMKKMQKRYGMDSGGASPHDMRPPGSTHVHKGHQEKRIDQSTGEYIDFEEVKET